MGTASATPGSTRKGSASTAPLLPVMPIAVRVPPGIAFGCQPRRRISSLTRSMSWGVASGFITINMGHLSPR